MKRRARGRLNKSRPRYDNSVVSLRKLYTVSQKKTSRFGWTVGWTYKPDKLGHTDLFA